MSDVHAIFYRPDDLFMPTCLEFETAPLRTRWSGTWDALGDVLAKSMPGNPSINPDYAKRARGAWIPGFYDPKILYGHRHVHVDLVETAIMVLDGDDADPHAVADLLEGYACFVHSTYKHRPEKPRCRVVLHTTVVRDKPTYDAALGGVTRVLATKGLTFPARDSSLGKLAYLPMHQVGVEPIFIRVPGQPLDVDAIVRAVRPAPTRPKVESPFYWPGSSRKSDPAAAIAHAIQKIISAPMGTRSTTLFATAAWLAKIGIPEDVIVDRLLQAALSVAREGEAARAKKQTDIRHGIRAGQAEAKS